MLEWLCVESGEVGGAVAVYRKTAKASHYLPRTGSYSTVPHRNGRVDVLPPDAGMPLYDAATQLAEAINRLEQIHKELEDVRRLKHSLGRIDKLRSRVGSDGSESRRVAELDAESARLDREGQLVKRRIGQLKSLLGGSKGASVEELFYRLAEHELPAEVFAVLVSKARSIYDKARAR